MPIRENMVTVFLWDGYLSNQYGRHGFSNRMQLQSTHWNLFMHVVCRWAIAHFILYTKAWNIYAGLINAIPNINYRDIS